MATRTRSHAISIGKTQRLPSGKKTIKEKRWTTDQDVSLIIKFGKQSIVHEDLLYIEAEESLETFLKGVAYWFSHVTWQQCLDRFEQLIMLAIHIATILKNPDFEYKEVTRAKYFLVPRELSCWKASDNGDAKQKFYTKRRLDFYDWMDQEVVGKSVDMHGRIPLLKGFREHLDEPKPYIGAYKKVDIEVKDEEEISRSGTPPGNSLPGCLGRDGDDDGDGAWDPNDSDDDRGGEAGDADGAAGEGDEGNGRSGRFRSSGCWKSSLFSRGNSGPTVAHVWQPGPKYSHSTPHFEHNTTHSTFSTTLGSLSDRRKCGRAAGYRGQRGEGK